MKICVFCSANQQIDQDFFRSTEELGEWAAKNGHSIVYGGVNCGLMECLAKAAKEAGKQMMMDQGDVFIALPGGIGTLDEIFTVAASATIGYHQKTVILYNMKGFWNPLIALLDDMGAKGMIRGDWHRYICVADSLEELAEMI